MNYEAAGLGLADKGEGLFHEVSIRLFGSMSVEKEKFNDERAWGVWTLKNGDKVFMVHTFAGEVVQGGSGQAKGTKNIIGGTGKYAGIKGSIPTIRHMVKSAVDGVGISYLKGTMKYTLPSSVREYSKREWI